MEQRYSDVDGRKQFKRDNSTMTTPSISKEMPLSQSSSNSNKLERPSVIMSTAKSASKYSHNVQPPCFEMQNLNINTTAYYDDKTDVSNETLKATEFDFTKINSLDNSQITQFKAFLEQSIQAAENQAANLKQVLNIVNIMFNNTPAEAAISQADLKPDLSSSKAANVPDTPDVVDTSVEGKNVIETTVSPVQEKNEIESEEKSPPPVKLLVNDADADLPKEVKEVSIDSSTEMARLSTIGEVSYEIDDSGKDDTDNNKENIENCNRSFLEPISSPCTPRTPRRRSRSTTACDSASRRRSARLAAKRRSSSDSDCKQDSFTLLENELNVVHNETIVPPWKSLPASPMKPPATPGAVGGKQWDKRVERPLKEYMALKMNGTFLVTPDVKRFQSQLEPTDCTPHSRKSMSRKIFMELCDLYAESPEPE